MKYVISFLVVLLARDLRALVPLEGLIFGGVQDIKQYDPFKNILSFDYARSSVDEYEKNKIERYYGLFKQGMNLKNSCELDPKIKYSSRWQMSIAARSIVGTLQYIGLDLSLKAITAYAKKLEYTDEKFSILAKNIVRNTCSQNLSVYSLKLLQDNFLNEWRVERANVLPDAGESPFFSNLFKQRQNTADFMEKGLDYSIRNFRAFCSWNGDTRDYRMLVPYIKNSYVMSHVFNNMKKKKISIDEKTRAVTLVPDSKGVQVACDDMICRRRGASDFEKRYPRMIGATRLDDDFSGLFCDHFSLARYRRTSTNKQVKKWISSQGFAESKLEVFHFLSLITKIPEALFVAKTYSEIPMFLNDNIKNRWDIWANNKLLQFDRDHLYEEPLEIKLIEQVDSDNIRSGKFNVLFDVGLSEIDKVLEGIDKIDTVFYLEVPVKYLAFMKEKVAYYHNKGKEEELAIVENKFLQMIKHQIDLKEKYFKIPGWNKDIAELIAGEILTQLNFYLGSKLNKLSSRKVRIPVRFRFGVFALHYIRDRYIYKEKDEKAFSFN